MHSCKNLFVEHDGLALRLFASRLAGELCAAVFTPAEHITKGFMQYAQIVPVYCQANVRAEVRL